MLLEIAKPLTTLHLCCPSGAGADPGRLVWWRAEKRRVRTERDEF